MWISKRRAKKQIRDATGKSLAKVESTVENMRQELDGKLWKVHRQDVQKAINDLSKPPERVAVKMKPLSPRHLAISRATAETKRIITKLQERMN